MAMAKYLEPDCLIDSVVIKEHPDSPYSSNKPSRKEMKALINRYWQYHIDNECRPDGREYKDEFLCPCGKTVFLACSECGEAIMAVPMPGTWCTHMASNFREWRG